ncbi:hypothetical protein BH20ACT10_BH20ACT10_07780 [soil metagenome]
MIPTHSLPPLSYEIPDSLSPKVGSLVVAPLSGKFRLGVVVEIADEADDGRATESLVSVSDEVSLPEGIVRLCEWAAVRTAISTAAALRAALPPGIETDKYRIVRPRRGWRWNEGSLLGRAELKRVLGETAMKAAEAVGRIELFPRLPRPGTEEWAEIRNGADPDFGRAYRQSEMFAALREGGGYMPVSELLSKAGASRSVLRSLAGRGAVGIEARPSNPIVVSSGEGNSAAATPRAPGSGLESDAPSEASRDRGVSPANSRDRDVSSATPRGLEGDASSENPRGLGSESERGVSYEASHGSGGEFGRDDASSAVSRGPEHDDSSETSRGHGSEFEREDSSAPSRGRGGESGRVASSGVSRGLEHDDSSAPSRRLGSEFGRGVSSAASRGLEGDASSAPSRGLGGEFERGVSSVMGRGSSLWRMPSGDVPEAVAAMGRAVVEGGLATPGRPTRTERMEMPGEATVGDGRMMPGRPSRAERAGMAGNAVVGGGRTMLVLAPEIRHVDGIVRHLERSLPRGATVAAYHGGIGRDRAEVWRKAGLGEIDVLVGTRAAALAPMARLGAICVADEPNEAHRAEPGYEGLPIHARELAARRGEMEDVPVLFLSPTPSLRLFSSEGGSELPPRRAERWPSVRLVDMRGSGADVSSTLVSACRETVASGGNVGVVVDRLGYATAVSCLNCGSVRSCPDCGVPLSLRGKTLTCARCGHRERHEPNECPECGSDRVSPTGMAVDRVRERLSDLLEMDIGLLTANERDLDEARVVVGTARPVLAREWGVVAIPDADSFLMGGWMGSVEQAFRVFHSAAESARTLLVAQTRNPEHYALQSALREDYETFAAAELPRLRRLGYPPYSHLASLTFRGRGDAVRGAVKSMLPAFGDGVEASEAVPVPGSARSSRWRVVLRSHSREAVAKAAAEAVRRLSKSSKGREMEMEVEIDPEEV